MLSKEQQEVIDTVLSNDSNNKIISVNSVAGSGKTTVCNSIINMYKPKNGLYTAFNKAIVQSSSLKFGNKILTKTLHSIAFNYIKPIKGIEEFSFNSIKENLSYYDKKIIIDTIDDFFRSKYINIEDYFINKDKNNLLDNKKIIKKYIILMLNNKIPVTFSCLLKMLHIKLFNKEIIINKDLLLLDECQDVTEVTLEIFKLIECNKKIILGDQFQNIYSFMNTVNAFELLKDTIKLKLTHSFRCSEDIADSVQTFGRTNLSKDFIFTGTDSINKDNKLAYLSEYNFSNLNASLVFIRNNIKFNLFKNIDEIFELPEILYNYKNHKIIKGKYSYLNKEFNNYLTNYKDISYYQYLKSLDIDEITKCIKFITNLNNMNINIFKLKNDMQSFNSTKSNIDISTIHAYKGLEADTVVINNDILSNIKNINNVSLEDMTKDMKQTNNLFYVALTRAKHKIIYDTIC